MNKFWKTAFLVTWVVIILLMVFLSIRLAEKDNINHNVINQYVTKGSGLSAYEVAVKNGYDGTEHEWVESLNGKDSKSTIVVVNKEVETQTVKEVNTIEQVPLKGESSYDLWVKMGNTGTENDYLLSLKGKDGGFVDLNIRFNNDIGLFQTKKGSETFWKSVPSCGISIGRLCN